MGESRWPIHFLLYFPVARSAEHVCPAAPATHCSPSHLHLFFPSLSRGDISMRQKCCFGYRDSVLLPLESEAIEPDGDPETHNSHIQP